MRLLKILMIVIGGLAFSGCSTTKHIIAHVDLTLEDPCIFEKFSESEKNTMMEDVGKKIYRNQQSCQIRYNKNRVILESHNIAHKN